MQRQRPFGLHATYTRLLTHADSERINLKNSSITRIIDRSVGCY